MTILVAPDPRLLQVSEPCESYEAALPVIRKLSMVFATADAWGLAAPQIGILKRVVIVVPVVGGIRVFVNPRITWQSEAREIDAEGCLSIPGRRILVERAVTIQLEHLKSGGIQSETFSGFAARVIQHEVDHLDGVLMTERER